jgi:hypothetical protein
MLSGLVHESSAAAPDEWWTPPHIFQALGLTFDLDPCSPGAGLGHVPARRHFTRADDGLSQPWSGLVWCNPPYGSQTPLWMRRMADHGDGVALVFNRSDTRWAQDALASAGAVCFLAGRVRFLKHGEPQGTPGTGSMLLGWGGTATVAVLRSGLGVVR